MIIGFFVSNNYLREAFASSVLSDLPREVRLSVEMDMLSMSDISDARQGSLISGRDFAQRLAIVMSRLGVTELSSVQSLSSNGILTVSGNFTRRHALEALARSAQYLHNNNVISIGSSPAKDFRDYRVPQKYRASIGYLQNKFVVRGLPDGRFVGNRRLTLRESSFFLYRFYEAVASDLMRARSADGVRFIDLSTNHPIMKHVNTLARTGALDVVMLQPSFDGNAYMTTGEATDILSGLYQRTRQRIDEVTLRTIFTRPGSSSPLKRKELAVMADHILSTFSEISHSYSGLRYRDVERGSSEYDALARLDSQDIRMGYPNWMFRGEEHVTWFEVVGLLGRVVEKAYGTGFEVRQPEKIDDRPATRDDIKRLKALIRARRERVHNILRRQ